ncbi:partial cobalt-precorrin-6B (C15)-methyltransferase, partial [Rhodocyclaceae bacterium]
MNTVAAAIAGARQAIPVAEARLLLGEVLGRNHAWLEAHRDDPLDAAAAERYAALVARRAAGEPVAYLLGRREFYGRDFAVSPAVLIPRPETERLVEVALASVAAVPSPRILDLGTGSGCIAVTLALELPAADVTAIDISEAALTTARENAERLGAKLRCLRSEWLDALAGERFDLIVSNPPYIAIGDRHLFEGDLRFEPAVALACGHDGLDAIRRILAAAPAHLEAGGMLHLEHG